MPDSSLNSSLNSGNLEPQLQGSDFPIRKVEVEVEAASWDFNLPQLHAST